MLIREGNRPSCLPCEVHRQLLLAQLLADGPAELDEDAPFTPEQRERMDAVAEDVRAWHAMNDQLRPVGSDAVFAGHFREALHRDDAAGSAVISACGYYRYRLERTLPAGSGTMVWLMLNPSTADAEQDDPTIRKCLGFAQALGFARIVVVNLFAWRSTDPAGLADARDPVGPENDDAIRAAVREADVVVCAWGAHGARFVARVQHVRRLLQDAGVHPVCYGLTKGKRPQPKHPLMLAYTTPLEPYTG